MFRLVGLLLCVTVSVIIHGWLVYCCVTVGVVVKQGRGGEL